MKDKDDMEMEEEEEDEEDNEGDNNIEYLNENIINNQNNNEDLKGPNDINTSI